MPTNGLGMLFILSWLVLQQSWADPGDPLPDVPAAPVEQPADERCAGPPPDLAEPYADAYKRARTTYLSGCHEEALQQFDALQDRALVETVPPSLYARSQQFRGEVQYMLGRRAAAMETFRALLRLQPNRQISPLDHHPGAVELYELAQSLVQSSPPDVTEPIKIERRPWWTAAPYGTTWFQLERSKTGRWIVLGQLAAGAVGIATLTWGRARWPGDVVGSTEQEKAGELAKARLVRALNFSANGSFVGLYIVSQIEARRVWRRSQRPAEPKRRVAPGGASIGIQGRF